MHSINLTVQNSVYQKLAKELSENRDIKLPHSLSITYEVCLDVLQQMYDLYEWDKAEKRLKNKNSLSYYALLMNQWINGISLRQIIKQSIQYHEEKNVQIRIDFRDFTTFIAGNKKHINIVIEKIIDDIEYILRFLFEKYFNHYFQVVSDLLGEDNAGENWASLLEYGTQNRMVIALQNTGLSRHTSTKIYEKSRAALQIKGGKLISVDKQMILTNFKKGSLEYQEILKFL